MIHQTYVSLLLVPSDFGPVARLRWEAVCSVYMVYAYVLLVTLRPADNVIGSLQVTVQIIPAIITAVERTDCFQYSLISNAVSYLED